jgi:hypothetical protein
MDRPESERSKSREETPKEGTTKSKARNVAMHKLSMQRSEDNCVFCRSGGLETLDAAEFWAKAYQNRAREADYP